MLFTQVLTPQYNSNLSSTNDIFNHSNTHFWQYMQPGYDALDFISCTGTNFLVRSNAYQVCAQDIQGLALWAVPEGCRCSDRQTDRQS